MDFRPGVVILADEAGNAIFEQFRSNGLPDYFQEPLRYGIGLIRRVEAAPPIYQCQLFSDPVVYDRASLMDAWHFIKERVDTTKAAEAGCIVPEEPIPHIYMVSHANSPEMRSIVKEIRDQGIKGLEISSLFSCDPFDETDVDKKHGDLVASRNEDAMTPELVAWARENEVRFCYLYGDVSRNVYKAHQKADFDYAAAEALFFLLTAGSVLEKQVQPDTIFYHGTLSTCMIVSPREMIRSACAAGVTRFLLAEWLDMLNQAASDLKDEPEQKAIDYSDKLRQWIMHIDKLADARPLTTTPILHRLRSRQYDQPEIPGMPVFSPASDLLRQHHFQDEQIAQYEAEQQKLSEQTRALVQSFTLDQAIHPEQWLVAMRLRFPPAKVAQAAWAAGPEAMMEDEAEWTNTHAKTWDVLENHACSNLKNSIEEMWYAQGIAWTVAYCDKVNDKLRELSQEIGQLREATLDELSNMSPPPLNTNTSKAGTIDTESLYKIVEEEVHVKPSGSSLPLTLVSIVAALMTSITLWFLLSVSFGENGWLSGALLFFCVAAGTFLWRNAYLKRATEKLTRAQKDLLDYYQRIKLLHCKLYHLARRRRLIEELKNCLRDTGMATATTFIAEVEEEFAARSQEAFAQQFRAEASKRDLFCGNKTWLKSVAKAKAEFLPAEPIQFPLKSVNPSRVEYIFKNISGEDKDRLVLRREAGLLASYKDPEGESFQTTLYRAVQDIVTGDKSNMKDIATGYMSTSDFAINLNEQELWKRVPEHLASPQLWRKQLKDPLVICLCANRYDMEVARAQLSQVYHPSPIVGAPRSFLRETRNFSNYSTNWLLTAAFFAQSDTAPDDPNR